MLTKARTILKKYYGYDSFRPAQEKIIESLLEGNDTAAIMPTGAGKSICFQIPALFFSGVTLVISPLISLMKDQVDSLLTQGLPATYINSSLAPAEMSRRLYDIEHGKYKLVYIAPERLQTDYLPDAFQNITVSMIAVDEAHCLSQWGHDFRPSYRKIMPFINLLPMRPLLAAFTATATPEVRGDIITLLGLKNPNVFVTGFDRPNLYFSVLQGENKQKFITSYVKSHPGQTGIIYAATRREVDSICDYLTKSGIAAGRYHAGMDDAARNREQDRFLYDEIQVIAATNAFGMGIDKSNVRYVIHNNMPKNIEAYYQEAGRSGRDGESGECILLFSKQDIMLQKFLIEKSVTDPVRLQSELMKLNDMAAYCQTTGCLRRFILNYFGETDTPPSCNNCENCNADSELIDITIDAQKVFSCIMRLRERFGVTVIAEVLKGSRSQKINKFHFDALPTYGIMGDRTLPEIRELIGRLAAMGYLVLDGGEFPVYKLTGAAIAVMRREKTVLQKVIKHKAAKVSNTLLDSLKNLRKTIAAESAIPPYMVFSDATLREMATLTPLTKDEMLTVKGVGEVKFERYGERFITEIMKYAAAHKLR
jgi:ATP-dependent DNA helicase RecQ